MFVGLNTIHVGHVKRGEFVRILKPCGGRFPTPTLAGLRCLRPFAFQGRISYGNLALPDKGKALLNVIDGPYDLLPDHSQDKLYGFFNYAEWSGNMLVYSLKGGRG